MIAKVCDRRRDGLSSFAAAIAYIAAPGKASHLALHEVLSLNIAAAQMRFTSDACPRCRDPLYHLVISWPEGESPTNDEVEDAARHLLCRIGFDDHQWVLAVHRNTLTSRAHPDLPGPSGNGTSSLSTPRLGYAGPCLPRGRTGARVEP